MKKIVVSFLMLLLCLSCSKKEEIIKIGIVAPLTGDGASYGAAMKRGFDLVFDDEKNIKLVYEDSRFSPRDGVNAINKLISQDEVQVVLGEAASGVSMAMVPIADKNKVILFSSISSSDNLRGISKYFFRNVPRNEMQGITAAKYIFQKLGKKRVAIFKKNDEYGNNLAKSFKGKIIAFGGQIILEDSYIPHSNDFREIITKMKSMNPEAVYVPGNYQEVAQFLKQAQELHFKTIFFGGDGSYSPELISIAGNSAEGTYYTQFALNKNEYYKKFEMKFVNKYNREPDIYDSYAYEAANIILKAITSVGNDATRIREYLINNTFPSLTGDLKFDEKGDVDRDYGVLIVEKGKFVEVKL